MSDDKKAHALSIRLWLACLATQETLCNYIGIRLGLYDALAGEPATADALAIRGSVAPRYAREWLEQQAVAGILTVEARPGTGERVFSLPEAHRVVLTDSDSPLSRVASMVPVGAVAYALPKLLEAYRTGAGLTDAAFGQDWRSGHGASNRALYVHTLPAWIRTVLPDMHARLVGDGARLADVACGAGWAAIALARAYPRLHVDGYEIDQELIADATAHAEQANVADRVRFHLHDCTRPGIQHKYDLICLFDTLHEVPAPVDMLRVCRDLRAEGGTVLVMDAKVTDEFTAPADDIERFQYTTSVLHCLPVCLSSQPSAGTGTVMRRGVVRKYAQEAGFSGVDVLRIDDRFHHLYRFR